MATWEQVRQAITNGNVVYAAINPYPVASWFDKLKYVSAQTGVPIDTIKALNPDYFTENILFSVNYENQSLPLLLTSNSPTPPTPPSGSTDFTLADNICPLPAGSYYVSQEFGNGHRGIDLSTNKVAGVPVYVVQQGTVSKVQAWDGHSTSHDQSWGNMILVNHGVTNGVTYTTRYAHLAAAPNFSVGQVIPKGTQLGTAGETGNATGIHLHLEVTANGTLVNPRNYVPI